MADMLADFFMKHLQGALFAHMRDQILNLPASKHTNVHRSVLGEGKKYDKARNHASRGKDAAVKTGKDSEDFSKDLNKSKYKNGKKTKVDGNPWENK